MLMLIEAALSEAFPAIKADDNMLSVVNATITDGLVFLFIIYFTVYRYRQRIISLGLSLKNFIKNFFYGIAGYLATIPLLVLALMLIVSLSTLFKYEPPMQPVLEIFLEERKRLSCTLQFL